MMIISLVYTYILVAVIDCSKDISIWRGNFEPDLVTQLPAVSYVSIGKSTGMLVNARAPYIKAHEFLWPFHLLVTICSNVTTLFIVCDKCNTASVNVGHCSGLGAILKEEIFHLVQIHCIAHRLELAILDVRIQCQLSRDSQSFVKILCSF